MEFKKKLKKSLLSLVLAGALLAGCAKLRPMPEKESHHGWKNSIEHGIKFLNEFNPDDSSFNMCKACHGDNLRGGPGSDLSCLSCHHKEALHKESLPETYNPKSTIDLTKCIPCHGEKLKGGVVDKSCFSSGCHHEGGWNNLSEHGSYFLEKSDNCKTCHGDDLKGGNGIDLSCLSCHHGEWSSSLDHTKYNDFSTCKSCHETKSTNIISCDSCHHEHQEGAHGSSFITNPGTCKSCHGDNLNGGNQGGASCLECHHSNNWENTTHGNKYNDGEKCLDCHGADLNGGLVNVSCNSCHHGNGKMAEGHANIDCETCHGINWENDTECETCHGTQGSHVTHTIANNKGPNPLLDCYDCHNTAQYPYLKDNKYLEDTIICNSCHSPGGGYDGVNDPNIGAKINWKNKVYDGNNLIEGKEKWCVGCHDNNPANSKEDGSGVYAPDVGGNNDTYGFYINGHKSVLCSECHNFSSTHIDGITKTYDAPEDIYSPEDYYQNGYRLNSINGQSPMVIPYRSEDNPFPLDKFRLCFSCHDNEPYTEQEELSSNFREDSTSANYHYIHLISKHNPNVGAGCMEYCHGMHSGSILAKPWDSDGDGQGDSDVSCSACHNIHGSGIAMIKSNFNLKYLDNNSEDPWNFKEPQTIEGSTGGAFDIEESPNSIGTIESNGVCLMCHQQRIDYYRGQ